ncbi:MAG: hypothetical protein DI533_00290 [Cereibacter sphaeroides]|uniref:DUF6948 domain-containing protein n=1 Tax=Cereibacter sphaeroides TaxID=1063 RepID=A0A2W5S805_CERSP|nr:MAG: hypothetical protein DI533_00290 [Cereibacter sphaeroides]
MDLKTLKTAVALLETIQSPDTQIPVFDGRKVIVRSRDAGVIYGDFAGSDGSTITLKNGVQMWKWFAAQGISLIDVATYGVKKSECKFSKASATVTIFNACALIDVTSEAAASIEAV